VSGTVTSQAIGFPLAHGKRVVPSGRLLSSRIKLTGFLTAGIWARSIAVHSAYYYYAAFNAPCVGRKNDESQAQNSSVLRL